MGPRPKRSLVPSLDSERRPPVNPRHHQLLFTTSCCISASTDSNLSRDSILSGTAQVLLFPFKILTIGGWPCLPCPGRKTPIPRRLPTLRRSPPFQRLAKAMLRILYVLPFRACKTGN